MKFQKTAVATAVGMSAILASGTAMAQAAANPIVTLLGAIDLTTVSAAVAVIALVLVGIKLTFKGPDVAGRVIKKV